MFLCIFVIGLNFNNVSVRLIAEVANITRHSFGCHRERKYWTIVIQASCVAFIKRMELIFMQLSRILLTSYSGQSINICAIYCFQKNLLNLRGVMVKCPKLIEFGNYQFNQWFAGIEPSNFRVTKSSCVG